MIFLAQDETVVEEKFGIEQDKNTDGYKFEFESRTCEIALRIFKWEGNVKTTAKSRIIVKRITDVQGDEIEETLLDTIDDSVILRDYDIFNHKYVIIVVEAGVEVKGVVKYIAKVGGAFA